MRGFCAVSALLQFSQGLVHVPSIHLHESEEREKRERRMSFMLDESRRLQTEK